METIDVQARSFVVKWLNVPDNSQVFFQARPIKRSVSVAVYRSNEQYDSLLNQSNDTDLRQRSKEVRSLSLDERITQSALSEIAQYGLIDGNQVYKNNFQVEKGGIFAFIFDNTFSKNYSKKILFANFFVSTIQPTGSGSPTIAQNSHRSNSSLSLATNSSSHLLNPTKGQYLQGFLLKKKRKKLQGFTKRFFILNFKDNTLSYYLNQNSLKMRGEMQLNISTISALKDENLIVIDSGMDVWTLKSLNSQDWKNWINALEFIKTNVNVHNLDSTENDSATSSPDLYPVNSTSKDFYQENTDKELFKIHQKINTLTSDLNNLGDLESLKNSLLHISRKVKSLIQDTDKFNLQGSTLSAGASIFSQEFFDAEEGNDNDLNDHVLMLQTKDKRQSSFSVDELSDDEDSMNISKLHINVINEEREDDQESQVLDEDLYPLPITEKIERREIIPPSKSAPQSLFALLRKNVGKDLSSISMPVTANEPISILQKICEGFEFANLLNDAALEQNQDLKFLKISTFAISCLGSFRSKVRNMRKPFNPILGETYEFIHEELNYRLIGEKICHKPQVFAVNIDSPLWEVSITISPDQKFWGKSVEIINKGSIKLNLKETGEFFKWVQPSTLLKNIITGERYSEPASSSLTITSSIGKTSTIEFKKVNNGGFFTSQPRSEEVLISITNSNNVKSDYYAEGKWTESITVKNHKNHKINDKIWTVSSLLPEEIKYWGFSKFTSKLNEITVLEKGNLPATDTRNRPDIRNYENGVVSEAEKFKLELEQRQRQARQDLIDRNVEYVPVFFKKVSELEYVLIKDKKSNYWERRKRGDWKGIRELW